MKTLAEGLTFPEGPRWHDGALWLSDMHAHRVLRLEADGTATTVAEVPECPSGLGFLPDGTPLVVSMHDRRLLRLEPGGPVEHADLSGLANWHCNDIWVDSGGRAFVGNFGDGSAPPDPPKPTALIAVEPDGAARIVAEDLWFPNGIAVSPDRSTLLVAESRSLPSRLTRFDVGPDGDLSNRRVLVEFEPGELADGIALDAELGVWVAMPFGNELVRVTAEGEIERRVPIESPYAVALGGPDGRDLFVCSAPAWEPDEAIRLRAGTVRTLRADVPAA